MDYIEVVGAYGRDYKSAVAVKADWNAGKDFRIVSYGQYQGSYVNRADAVEAGMKIMVRYAKNTKVVVIK